MSSGLRIALLIPSMRGAGGTERLVHNLARLLADAGHVVAIAGFDAAHAPRHFADAADWHPLGPIRPRPLLLRWLEYAAAARALARFKRAWRPDVTISNLWRADLVSQLAGGADAKVALAHINVLGNPSNRMMVRLRPLVAMVYRRFARVVAVTAPLARELAALYRLAPGQVCNIDNFTAVPPASPCLPDDGRVRFVWCGRLVAEKNLAGLLPLWAEFSAGRVGAQLVVLGDGPQRAMLAQQAARLGLRGGPLDDPAADLVWAGTVPNPADFTIGARALVLSSQAEGMPMVLLEAMALGVPVLAADCPAGGVRAALSDSETAVETGFGALLPVPRGGAGAGCALWLAWLERAAAGDEAAAWRAAALARAARFSPATAARAWGALLETLA